MDTLKGFTGLTLSNSTLSSINLEKSTLNACTLANLAIHNSTISDSVLTNCRIHGSILKLSCSIKGSKLYKCKIFNMKEIKDCELHECELAFERCTLEKFPVEVRRMIFELCLQRKRKERGCALIAALRGQGQIYQEALEVFRKLNSFPFQYGDSEKFKILPSRVVSTIRKISIVVNDDNKKDSMLAWTPVPDMIGNAFHWCKMLTEVELYYGSLSSRQIRDGISEAVKAIVERCKSLTALTVIGNLPLIFRGFATSAAEVQMLVAIENISHRLGVNAAQVPALVAGKVSLVCRAGNGTTLTWKNNI